MLWVELQPDWKIENTGCCVCGRTAACMGNQRDVGCSCLCSWPFLLAAVVKAFSWRPDISLGRTVYMATNQKSGPSHCPCLPFLNMMWCFGFLFGFQGHHKSKNTGGEWGWYICGKWCSCSCSLSIVHSVACPPMSDFILFNMQENMTCPLVVLRNVNAKITSRC